MTEPTPEAYAAARNAAQAVYFSHVGQTVTQAGRLVDPYARAAVDAVWPIAEATVRAKVAAEIRAYAAGCMCIDPDNCPYDAAARIAEGPTQSKIRPTL